MSETNKRANGRGRSWNALPTEKRDAIIELRKTGAKLEDIAKQVKVAQSTVSRVLGKAKAKPATGAGPTLTKGGAKRWPDDVKRAAVAAYKMGESPRDIGKRLGIPNPSTIYGWLTGKQRKAKAKAPREDRQLQLTAVNQALQKEHDPKQILWALADRYAHDLSAALGVEVAALHIDLRKRTASVEVVKTITFEG